MSACDVKLCHKKTKARGLCVSHYKRFLKYGDPLAGSTSKGAPWAFIEKALKTKTDDCIIWPYSKGHKGYAQINKGGRRKIVSRLVCLMAHGAPPTKNHHAAHNCGNGHAACINHRHLRWALPAENEADKERHGTLLHGEKAPWANLSKTDVQEIFSRANAGENQSDIAACFNISQQMVSSIKTKRRWVRVLEVITMKEERPARKAIPMFVKRAVVQRQNGVCKCGCGMAVSARPNTGTKFDHRPPIRLRNIAHDGKDYDPPQHSPDHIDAICRTEHDRRTFGTGATTAGSDTGAIKKERKRRKKALGIGRPKAKIRSGGFRKDISRRMDGTVKKRGK